MKSPLANLKSSISNLKFEISNSSPAISNLQSAISNLKFEISNLKSSIRPARILACLALLSTLASGQGAINCTPLGFFAGALRAPARLAVDTNGFAYVADPAAAQVCKVDSFGRVLAVRNFKKPLGIAVDGSGNLCLGQEDSRSVSVFDGQGTLLYKLGRGDGEFVIPGFVGADPSPGSHRVYVSDSSSDVVKAYDGPALAFVLGGTGSNPAQFNFPAGLWVGASGDVFVVDQGNDRVEVFSSSGQYLRQFSLVTSLSPAVGAVGGRSQGITGDSSGRVYVSDTFQDLIRVFSAQGNFLGAIGGLGEATGHFRSPAGLAVDSQNRLLVASANNGRVELLGLDSFLHLTVSPPNRVVRAGTDVSFSALSGAGSPSFQWQKNGRNLTEGGNVSGSGTGALVLSRVTPADSGSYSVTLSDGSRAVSSPAADLLVVEAPAVLAPPIDQVVPLGSNVLFTVVAAGDPLQYQWAHNGNNLPGATGSSLRLDAVKLADAGHYTVLLTNAVGSAAATARLEVLAQPVIVIQPLSTFVVQGNPALFEVVAEGAGLTYQWSFNGAALPGRTAATLSLNSAQTNLAGLYSVTVQNAAGSISSDPAQLVVLVPPAESPEVSSLAFSSGDQADLVIAAAPGFNFAIDASHDLQSWTTISRFQAVTGSYRFTDPDAPAFSQRFYRVRWAPVLTPAP